MRAFAPIWDDSPLPRETDSCQPLKYAILGATQSDRHSCASADTVQQEHQPTGNEGELSGSRSKGSHHGWYAARTGILIMWLLRKHKYCDTLLFMCIVFGHRHGFTWGIYPQYTAL
jgi:hypothetical protein